MRSNTFVLKMFHILLIIFPTWISTYNLDPIVHVKCNPTIEYNGYEKCKWKKFREWKKAVYNSILI